ncbi:MAG: hypothetical protein ACHQFZ_05435 [Acidimicrobiales bacterium]
MYTHVPVVIPNPPSLAPVYPFVAGGAEALFRVGHAVPFPVAAGGPTHCSAAYDASYRWALHAGAFTPTRWLSLISWFPLMGGVIAMLRVSGRGRRMSEPLTLLVIALLPQVTSCISYVFHPEYLFAVGLALIAAAAAVRDRWAFAGVLLGLAFLSQQFALLVGVTLFAVAVGRARWRLAAAAFATVALITVPLAAATSGRALKTVVFGTSRVTLLTPSFVRSKGGTVLWEAHLHGAPLFAAARLLPVLVAMAVADWARRKLGRRALEPETLMSLIAIAFAVRLVFEQNLFGYYFMALAVALVVREVIHGQFRLRLLTWILVLTVAFNAIPSNFGSRWEPWGGFAFDAVCAFVACFLLAVATRDLARGRVRIDAWLTFAFVIVVFRTQIFEGSIVHQTLSDWLWQLILVPTGIALAAVPLLATVRNMEHGANQSPPEEIVAN